MTTGSGTTSELARLREAVEALERRVAALEGGTPAVVTPAGADVPAAPPLETSLPSFPARRAVALLGRSLLVLAGAFLLRAFTDRGLLPAGAGFGLGLAYALVLCALADRVAGRGDRAGGVVHGLVALVIGFPFLAETTGRLGLVPPAAGGAGLVLLTGTGLAVAWRRRLPLLYWALSLGALATTLLLHAATGAVELFTVLLLALGAATVVFSYGRGWYLARWPVALAVDALVLRLVVMSANPGGVTAGDRTVSDGAVLALALALAVVYLGLFSVRALVHGRGVKAFDVVQSLLVIAVGYGGAAHVAARAGGGLLVGTAGLAVACFGYAVAFTVVRQRHGRGRGFFYFANLGMLMLVLGAEPLTTGPWLAWTWLALGLAAALLGGRFDRVTLRAHAAVYLTLAAVRTGAVVAAVDAFAGDPSSPWHGLGAAAAATLVVTALCYVLLARTPGRQSRARRVPRLLVAVLTLLGLGAVVVDLLLRLAGSLPPAADPAVVAVVRTGVLAATAVALAAAARHERLAELGWLVYPVLVVGCAKLLVEDLARGHAVGLTVGFALFGTALLLAPRLLHRGRTAAADQPESPRT